MTVSKRLRFEILRRDNHACRYCGASAPDAKLTVDHVIPEALGGSDDPTNLVAACADCNTGKSSVPADAALVADVASDAMRWAAAMRQAADEIAAEDDAIERILDAVYDAWKPYWIPNDWPSSVVAFIRAGLTQDTLLYLVDTARRKRGLDDRWAYFCGCCWKRVRQLQDRAHEIVSATECPPAAPALLTTRWTAEEIRDHEADALEFAKQWCGDDVLDHVLGRAPSPACRHGVDPHCGDPACAVEHAGCLYLVGSGWKNTTESARRRADAVIAEAEALLDG
ncbi:hypothetical protein CKJ63_03530 [Mycobacterium avium]|uniref:HNH endonuclease n=1 Tax=Mycobacterium avium TaxID=1764 RepID=UPI000BB02FE0|nr:HNH endonuclease [Mycobacterium avium]PBA43543.1 hypothetical protein CKJ63_03530 [Mycobacterium avium]PBA85432.1 hypothetical protein CKJ72_03915 [Mycobacterium avium]